MNRSIRLFWALTTFVLAALPAPAPAQEEEEEEIQFTAELIIEFKKEGVEDADILEELRASKTKLIFTAAQLNSLKRAGAGPALLAALGAKEPKPKPKTKTKPKPTPKQVPEPRVGEPARNPQPADAKRPGPQAEPKGMWTPAVWVASGVAPAGSVADRCSEAISKLSYIYRAFINTGRFVEASEYFEAYQHMARAHGLPPWGQALAAANLAAARLRLGQVDAGVAALDAAVHLGFADPYSFHEDVPRSLWTDGRIRDIYRRMALHPADLHEIGWIRRELTAMEHDLKMVIVANMNRKDHVWTKFATVAVPARISQNSAVEGWRQALRFTRQQYAFKVMMSDQMRKSHLTTLQILGQSPPVADQLTSIRLAEQRERAQADSVADREYRPGSARAGGKTLPELGSLEIEQAVVPAVALVRDGEDSTRSAWREMQAGDWWESRITVRSGDEVSARESIKKWVTARDGNLVSLILVRSTDKATTIEDDFSRLMPTNKEQLYFDLSQQGHVEIESYEESGARYELQGREIAARRIAMRYQWTLDGNRAVWTLEGIVAPDACRGAFLELRLATAGRTIHEKLSGWGRQQPTRR